MLSGAKSYQFSVIAALLFLTATIGAQTNNLQHSHAVHSGSLITLLKDATASELPLMDTQVNISIHGLVARTTVKQFFENPSSDTIEATYVFPLPEDSAVDYLKMTIGDRQIIGQIKVKKEARKIYEQARKAGKKAALMLQSRDNLFRTRVANINPGEVIEVHLEYAQKVQFKDNKFSLRFPSTLTPRYEPETTQKVVETFNLTKTSTHLNPDTSVQTQTVPQALRPDHQLSIDVTLKTGFAVQSLSSANHAIATKKHGLGDYAIRLQKYQVADRDFELVWQAEESLTPRLINYHELDIEQNGQVYSLAMLLPPTDKHTQIQPRDVTFIIDQSGSMGGQSIKQAKQALALAVSQLTAKDRFNIIAFNDEHQSLFSDQMVADSIQRTWAQSFISNIEAGGGTEMLPALQQALGETTTPGYVRQIIFLTDGAISNEAQLFKMIAAELGEARLFTVGIGSAPNSYFMRKAAQFGRGSFTYINRIDEVNSKMQQLLQQLQYPTLTDIQTQWSEEVVQYPARVPDLYLGEPVMLLSRRPNVATNLEVTGRLGQTQWHAKVTMPAVIDQQQIGLGKLWARAKISALLDEQITTGDPDLHKQEIIDLALAQQLMSRYTSFVAVEQRISRPKDAELKSKNIPNLKPVGSEQFSYPQTATSWQLFSLIGLLMILATSLVLWRNKTRR